MTTQCHNVLLKMFSSTLRGKLSPNLHQTAQKPASWQGLVDAAFPKLT